MKRFFTVLLLAAVASLCSFTTSDFSAVKAPPFSDIVETDLTGVILDGCDEQVRITEGTLVEEYFGYINEKSGNVRWHISLHGKAVGLSSGKQYTINLEANHAAAGVVTDGQFSVRHTTVFLIIGDGTTYKENLFYKFTINANGEIIKKELEITSDCN